MKSILVVLTFLLIQPCFSQNEDAAIRQTISQLFDGMRQSDTGMIRAAFAPGAILQTVIRNKEGKVIIQSEPLDSFLFFMSKPHKEVYDERISFELIKTDGDLATAWTPYKFYLGATFSHCGVDSYQLVRLNGIWKIQYLIDTRRKSGCD